MLQTWRWFGPDDPVSLGDIRQAGVQGIVTALHQIYDGRAWSPDDIAQRQNLLRAAGYEWSVCESIPVHTAIKLGDGARRRHIDAWKDSLANLGRAGVPVVCYNFMPVVDWTRTNLRYPMPSGGLALRFDMVEFVAYDVHVLKRRDAEADYPQALLDAAKHRLAALDDDAIATIEHTIIAGLPGNEGTHTRDGIRTQIQAFDAVSSQDMRENLVSFLREIVPVAADVGVRLAIHPDDPPFSLFGLPRVVSTPDDAQTILDAVAHDANGLTLCAGSYGSRADNDPAEMARRFGSRIHFAHLRNVAREADGSFVESDHLDGDVDMIGVVSELIREERRRAEHGDLTPIPMRPDHGHLLLDDITKTVNPGYSCIGRLKGLAELRGVMQTAERLLPR
ncbi:mannonate dehydratase [Acetobacteraceae bacterium KSS8]|uniref:Mannonate dehydratase n=1 Tax=Endosaccharibacter trunci TaxID=2812733 RepID=A0ABT1WAY5_9PROT|nr:mannonate dehydratase [Acetobacteraceae bacterium KSS8]